MCSSDLVLKDFQEIAAALKDIKGKFMLSINDHPDIREIFKDFNKKSVSLLYTVSSTGPIEANELIYSNFDFKENRAMGLFDGFQ